MITLRPIAIYDLNSRYARDMGDNKVRHYILPVSLQVVKKFTGQSVEDVIRDYIKRTENESEVIFEEALVPAFFDDGQLETKYIGKGLTVTDVSKLILDQDKDIGRALLKRTSKSTIYQWNYYPTVFHNLYDRFVYFYNKMVPSINKFLYKLQGADYSTYNHFVKQLGYLQQIYIRKIDQVHFISIAFEAGDAERALKEFRQDLRILKDKKLIMGNLAMPSVLALADTVGLGRYYAMYCFPIINHDRLIKVSGLKSLLDLPQKNPLSLVGVKHEAFEGDVNWLDGKTPEDKYQIEKIYITDLDSEDRQKQVIDCYQGSVDHVNAVAASMKEDLKNTVKVKSNVEHLDMKHIKIDTTVLDKRSGKTLDVGETYNADDMRYKKIRDDNDSY